jgi:glucan phosphoethanolaminetransferase (alkaline phosphatase superfamily)
MVRGWVYVLLLLLLCLFIYLFIYLRVDGTPQLFRLLRFPFFSIYFLSLALCCAISYSFLFFIINREKEKERERRASPINAWWNNRVGCLGGKYKKKKKKKNKWKMSRRKNTKTAYVAQDGGGDLLFPSFLVLSMKTKQHRRYIRI